MDECVVPRSVEEGGPWGLTTLLLRRVSAGSAGRARELLAAEAASSGLGPGIDPGTEEHCLYALVDMASDDPEEPLAAAMVMAPDARGQAEVRALAVAAAYRGRGLDGRILAAVVDLLRTAGVRRVLASPARHAGTERLYRQADFRPTTAGERRRDGTANQALDSWYELEL